MVDHSSDLRWKTPSSKLAFTVLSNSQETRWNDWRRQRREDLIFADQSRLAIRVFLAIALVSANAKAIVVVPLFDTADATRLMGVFWAVFFPVALMERIFWSTAARIRLIDSEQYDSGSLKILFAGKISPFVVCMRYDADHPCV